MLCQSQLNRLVLNPNSSFNVRDQAFDNDPRWKWSSMVKPSSFPGLSLGDRDGLSGWCESEYGDVLALTTGVHRSTKVEPMRVTSSKRVSRFNPTAKSKAKRSTRILPRGFTLMETLVALGLCGLIVGSVGTSIDLYWKYRTLSRDRVTSSHVLRGIVEDLTGDLRSAMSHVRVRSAEDSELPENVRAAIESGALSATAESSLRIQEQFLNLQTNQTGIPIHFVGTQSAIAIFTDHNNPRFPASGQTYKTARQQHVVWWVNNGQPMRMSLSQIGPRQVQSSLTAAGLPSGLVRATESFGSNDRGSTGDSNPTQVISRGVNSIQFRYFNGFEWYGEWDSVKRMALPAAVEISLTLKDQPSKVNTFVVSIPQGS